MKNFCTVLFFSLIIFSCSKKEDKNEIIKDENLSVKDSITEVVKEIEKIPELIFTVQIAAIKKEDTRLNMLENIQIFQEKNLIKYRLGKFATYKEARAHRVLLLNTYSDAFVQALRNEKPINITEALSN